MQNLKVRKQQKMTHEYLILYTGFNSLRKFLHSKAFVDEFKFN